MKILETDRLALRLQTTDDAAFILELMNDPSWLKFIGIKPKYVYCTNYLVIIKNTDWSPVIYNLQQFIEPREKLLGEGHLIDFKEEETYEITEIFGNIAHRFSLYQKSGVLSGEAFATMGMKTIQFIHTPSGWKISSVAWDDERSGLTIPDKYRK